MPLTSSDPELGCCRSAITRSMVVLPQPDGPMKDTNSPSATARSTCDSASTRPSAVSKVSEISFASTTSRFGCGSSDRAGEGGAAEGANLTDVREDKVVPDGLIAGSLLPGMLSSGDALQECGKSRQIRRAQCL